MFLKNNIKHKNSFTAKFLFAGCVMILLFFSQTVSAKSLTEYKNNIEFLQKKFASMATGDVTEEFINETFERSAKLLPAEETIETDGISLSVNNEWLAKDIANYKSETDANKSKLILVSINERLEAIKLKIIELEKATENSTSKDEEKRKLAEILKREEFGKPSEEQKSLFQRFLDWLDQLLRKNAPKERQKKLPPSNFGGVITYLQFILYALVIGAVLFMVYKFSPLLIRKFREREKKDENEKIILGEKISADETSLSLFSEAEKLANDGNLRDAIRKGYIAFLFELNERKLIGLAKHKTNRDYLRSIRKKRELYNNMDGLTLNYERHWYGFEEAEESDWQDFREKYKEALK